MKKAEKSTKETTKKVAAKKTTAKTATKASEKVATKASEKVAPKAAKKKSVTEEQIRQRAIEIYFESGCIPGRDIENWTQAEKELKG